MLILKSCAAALVALWNAKFCRVCRQWDLDYVPAAPGEAGCTGCGRDLSS